MNMKKFKHSGFTMLELIAGVALIGVVSAIGIPAYKAMKVTNELVDASNSLRMSMKLARSEAISRGKNTIICSSDTSVVPNACSQAAGNWIKGWIVGIDLNADGNIKEADGELLWAHKMGESTQLTITPTDSVFDDKITYLYSGWITAGVAGGFDICSGFGLAAGYPVRQIRASIAGDPQLTKVLGSANRC